MRRFARQALMFAMAAAGLCEANGDVLQALALPLGGRGSA